MQKFTVATMSTSPTKSESLKHSPKLITKKKTSPELGTLSDRHIQMPHHMPKNITIEQILQYIQSLYNNIYEVDNLKIKELVFDFLENDLPKLRHKLQQRLSLLKYLCQSLKYKQYVEIDTQIQKQCKKNMLFVSINTIWIAKMMTYDFNSAEEFFNQYHKHVYVVANMIYYYFKEAFVLLNSKDPDIFLYIQEETAHSVVNALNDWETIYHMKLLPLLRKQNVREQNVPHMGFDVVELSLNQMYIKVKQEENQLPETVKAMIQFSQEHTLACKIMRLKEIRQKFLKQLEESRQRIAKQQGHKEYTVLEKDDIIGCIIYCIVKGKVNLLQQSLQALTGVLGNQSQLLSRKGVDSYRADLESAVQYLVQQSEVQLILVPNELKLFQK